MSALKLTSNVVTYKGEKDLIVTATTQTKGEWYVEVTYEDVLICDGYAPNTESMRYVAEDLHKDALEILALYPSDEE